MTAWHCCERTAETACLQLTADHAKVSQALRMLAAASAAADAETRGREAEEAANRRQLQVRCGVCFSVCSRSSRLVLQGEVERVTLQWEHAAEQQAALHAEVTSLTQQLHEMREQVAAARDGSRCFEEKAADASEALHLLQSCCQRLEKEVAQAQAAEAEVREEVVVWQSQAAGQEDVVRQLQDTLAAAQEERAQLLHMVSSSTAALAATAGRCDELKQHEVVLREELRASQMHLHLLQQNQRGVAAAAAAVADMKRAVLDMQDAVPALVEEVRRESERNVYALVAAVTHSMSSKDKAQNTELFNRAMQVQPAPYAAPPLL